MASKICPVAAAIQWLSEIIFSGDLKNARCKQRAEEILRLLEDISSGRGGEDHFPAIRSLSTALLEEGPDRSCVDTGKEILARLDQHRETFLSHLRTHNCPDATCVRLVPAPCQIACPAGIDVPSYVTLIGQGRDGEAIDLIRKDNPFPWVCGLVCTNPCEFMCVRGRIDKPVSIKYLKGFAAEKAMSDRRYRNPEKSPDKNRKVCVIGAGPGGVDRSLLPRAERLWGNGHRSASHGGGHDDGRHSQISSSAGGDRPGSGDD